MENKYLNEAIIGNKNILAIYTKRRVTKVVLSK